MRELIVEPLSPAATLGARITGVRLESLDDASWTAIEAAFHSEGYRTTRAPSPWRLGPAEAELTHQLVAGWCTAAAEQRPDEREVITAWGERRRSSIDAGTFELTVGHVDVLALPPG